MAQHKNNNNKTHDLFLTSARTLFAEKGFDRTTMNDIAVEAGRGRRTLYTYFKSKNDIFVAVIAQELAHLQVELEEIANLDIKPSEKLIRFVFKRLDAIKEVVERNGSLNAAFFQDIAQVERSRLRFDIEEKVLIRRILKAGIKEGAFDVTQPKLTADILHYCLKGLEVPYIKGLLWRHNVSQSESYRMIKQCLLKGILK